MVKRDFWLKKIEQAWKTHSILWLSGIRRVGKTYLCKSLSGIEYFDCELPSVRRMMEDVESFLNDHRNRMIALDEIHRLDNPSEILKIAADHYPDIRILATGSSTLTASAKFRDTLTGRKSELWLTPMTLEDMAGFNNNDLKYRFLHGGLPPFFLSESISEYDFQEWMDAYWAKDIQELFRIERRHSFLKFVELLIVHSGGIFEANKYARPCEISRQTVSNYLSVLEATYIVHIVRPFSSYRPTEIISAPKVYAFDTGFICYYRGWKELRQDDLGILWEHFVLNEIQAHLQSHRILYWRDKNGHEVDFVLVEKQSDPIVIECKWSVSEFDPKNIKIFRKRYPCGNNYVVAPDVTMPFSRNYDNIQVRFLDLKGLIDTIG